MGFGFGKASHRACQDPEGFVKKVKDGKRHKEVFASDEIPHLWAHRAQASARNSQGNMFFRDATIYSYGTHFPIASHVTGKGGKAAVLFTTETYSATTSAHCHAVRQAIPKSVPAFRALYVSVPVRESEHAENLKYSIKRSAEFVLKAARSRKNSARYIVEAETWRENAIAYAKFFGLRKPEIAPIPKLSSDALAAFKKRDAEKRAKEAQKTLKANKERIAQWLAGRTQGDLPIGVFSLPASIPTLLRIIDGEVETSRGAAFPIAHAKRGLALVRAVMARGEEWKANGHTCHLGHYAIDRITADGTVYAGCHVVPFASIERIAPQIDAFVAPEIEQRGDETGEQVSQRLYGQQ